MTLPHRTSLSDMSEHDWNILSARWARGIDWMVHKLGARHWEIVGFPTHNAGFPLFKTKREAHQKATDLLLAESHYRAAKRNGLPTYD